METKRILFVKGQRLTRQLNIRRTLLAAVDHFLEGSPGSLTKAHRLVARCYAARQFVTLDEIVWGGVIMALTDAEYYSHVPRLQQYRTLLSEGSAEIHRAYLNFNFGSDFTPEERAWLNRLHDLLDFLGGFPFPAADLDQTVALEEYERRVEEINQVMLQSPPPPRLEDEMIYHLILREVSTILVNIDLRYALLRRTTHLVPRGSYSSFPPQPKLGRDDTPDISADLNWARRALRSMVEQGWLLLTWQVTPTHYHLSLH